MWTRIEIKQRAKENLSRNYSKLLLASFILTMFMGINITGSIVFFNKLGNIRIQNSLINFLVFIFLLFPLKVGVSKFMINSVSDHHNFNDILFCFNKNYKNIVFVGLLKYAYVTLWTLLFIIPGIVKHYEYCMVEYIMADYPDLSAEEALEFSKSITNGEKMAMFILDLSFIGWYLLSLCLLFFGYILVVPYVKATYTELYLRLKRKKINV